MAARQYLVSAWGTVNERNAQQHLVSGRGFLNETSVAGSTGSSAGTSTASGTGQSLYSGVGSSTGAAGGTGVGQSTADSSGTSTGSGVATGAAADSTGAGTSTGTSTVSGVGAEIVQTSGTSTGTSTATGDGGFTNAAQVLSYFVTGWGNVNETYSRQYFVAGKGSLCETQLTGHSGTATGQGTATGAGAFVSGSDGISTGTSTVTGVTSATTASTGTSTGLGAASAVGVQASASSGSSTGTSTASGVGTHQFESPVFYCNMDDVFNVAVIQSVVVPRAEGAAIGEADAEGVGQSTAQTVGSSAGTSTVSGVAVPVDGTHQGVGTSTGTSIVSGVAPNSTLMTLPAGASAIYSVAQYENWTGSCCRVVRASDLAELDIGFVNGWMDTDAIIAFQGVSTVSFTTMYDQSGNGNDATYTGTAKPLFLTSNAIRGKQGLTHYNASLARLNLPSSLSVDRRTCTVFSVSALMASTGPDALWNLDTVSTKRLSLLLSGQKQILNTASFLATGLPARAQMELNVLSASATANILHGDERISASLTPTASAITSGGWIGKSDPVGYGFYGEFFMLAIYNTTLSPSTIASAKTALYPIFDILTTGTKRISFPGDSVTWGQGSSTGQGYVRRLDAALSERVYINNTGVPGRTLSLIYSNLVSFGDSGYDATLDKNILHIWAGSNDITLNSATAANTYNNKLIPYIQNQQARGYDTIIVPTMMQRIDCTGAKETERLAYNALITGGTSTYGYVAPDYAGLPMTFSDGVHPNDAGYELIKNLLLPVVEAALV